MRLKLGKTEVEFSYTLLCLTAAAALLGVLGGFLWCAAAIVIHEGGHLLMMARLGYFPQRIKIALFSIDIVDNDRQRRTMRENVLIIFFGPFANFICFLPGFLLYLRGINACLPFAAANLSVGLFNSLPVTSLDGGMLLYAWLSRRWSPVAAARAVDLCTFVCIFPLAALGFWLLLRERNLSLLFVSGYLAAALIWKKDRID